MPRPIGWIGTVSPSGAHNLAPYSQFTNLTFDPPYVLFSANQTPAGARKDTVVNAEATGRFTWSLATWDLREAVNVTAEQVSPDTDEFERAGLAKVFSIVLGGGGHDDDGGDGVAPGGAAGGEEEKEEEREERERAAAALGAGPRVPMVAASPVRFECAYHSTVRLPGHPPMGTVDVVIGRVVAVHIDDGALTDGRLDVRKTQPIARCGYYEYAVVRDTFEMVIPGGGGSGGRGGGGGGGGGGQWGDEVLGGLEGSASRNRALHEAQQKKKKREEEEEE